MIGSHYIAILSKLLKGLELVSSLDNRAKNKLEMFVIIWDNTWANFILMVRRILEKQLKV